MKLVKTPIPPRHTGRKNLWGQNVTAEAQAQLVRNPGEFFQVYDKNDKPRELSFYDVAGMRGAAPKGFRVRQRSVTDEPNPRDRSQHVWVAYDPGYFERIRRKQTKK